MNTVLQSYMDLVEVSNWINKVENVWKQSLSPYSKKRENNTKHFFCEMKQSLLFILYIIA